MGIDFSAIHKSTGLKTSLSTPGGVISIVVPVLFIIAGFILLFYLISGGFALMFSKGDQRAVEAGKAKITSAVTGFIILFVSFWLVQILGDIFQISQFKQIF